MSRTQTCSSGACLVGEAHQYICDSVELSDQFLTITAQRTRCPLQLLSGEEIVDLWNGGETTHKDQPFHCKGPCHDSFIIQKLGI